MSFGLMAINDMWMFTIKFNEFLNFKFISEFALIHENIVFLQIQILLC
jgi:hypothetical protein